MSILPYPKSLNALFDQTLAKLLPGSCLLCGGDSHCTLLCQACTDDLPAARQPACPLCGDATTHGERCGACLKDAPSFDRTSALFTYDFPVDRLIQALKYGHQIALARWFGQRMAEQSPALTADAIIPMPLHPNRIRERGFNQSMEIARTFGNWLKIPVDRETLRRVRSTTPQAELPPKERHRNVRGAFECSHDYAGQRLILVDDVMTTGASANECARVLKIHGALEVNIYVVARALKH